MTIALVLTAGRLREVHALEQVRRAIAASECDRAWLYVVPVLDARIDELRALLDREDPQVLREAENLQNPPPDTSADEAFLRSLFIAMN
jgi:hypothetical protein